MSCNHTMSLSRGCCIHCGMPDPSLSPSTESIPNPSADLMMSMAKLASESINEVTERPSFMRQMLDRLNKDANDQINAQYKSLFLSTPRGPDDARMISSRREFDKFYAADEIVLPEQGLCSLEIGSTLGIALDEVNGNLVFMSGRRSGKSMMMADLINKTLANVVQVGGSRRDHTMAVMPSNAYQDYMVKTWPFDDTVPPQDENPCRDLCLTYEETYDGSEWRKWQEHMNMWRDMIKQPMPRLVDVSLVAHPTIEGAMLNLAGATVEVTGSRFNEATHEMTFDLAITPPTPIKMMPLPDTQLFDYFEKEVRELRHRSLGISEPGFINKELISNGELSLGTESWEVPVGELGTVEGFGFLRPNVKIREVDLTTRVPSFQQWWTDSVSSLTNPHGEMELPRESEAPPFNQESIDWYTAVADEMLDQCERDGEDRGTTFLRLTNALQNQLPTQTKVRVVYKKVGMFCIDIERFDANTSLVIERKSWWSE